MKHIHKIYYYFALIYIETQIDLFIERFNIFGNANVYPKHIFRRRIRMGIAFICRSNNKGRKHKILSFRILQTLNLLTIEFYPHIKFIFVAFSQSALVLSFNKIEDE